MYLTVRRYENVKDPQEVEKRVKERFVPMIRQLPGFIAYHLVDGGGGVMLSTSIFQDKAGADASTQKAAEWVKAEMSDLVMSKPQVTAGDALILTYTDQK